MANDAKPTDAAESTNRDPTDETLWKDIPDDAGAEMVETIPPDPRADQERDSFMGVADDFLDGHLTLPEALEELTEVLAAKYDIPLVPERWERKLAEMVAEATMKLLDVIRSRLL